MVVNTHLMRTISKYTAFFQINSFKKPTGNKIFHLSLDQKFFLFDEILTLKH